MLFILILLLYYAEKVLLFSTNSLNLEAKRTILLDVCLFISQIGANFCIIV